MNVETMKEITMQEIPHPCLDVNELAFTVRVSSPTSLAELCLPPSGSRGKIPAAVMLSREPIINLETVNYLLAGIQANLDTPGPWKTAVWDGLGLSSLSSIRAGITKDTGKNSIIDRKNMLISLQKRKSN